MLLVSCLSPAPSSHQIIMITYLQIFSTFYFHHNKHPFIRIISKSCKIFYLATIQLHVGVLICTMEFSAVISNL